MKRTTPTLLLLVVVGLLVACVDAEYFRLQLLSPRAAHVIRATKRGRRADATDSTLESEVAGETSASDSLEPIEYAAGDTISVEVLMQIYGDDDFRPLLAPRRPVVQPNGLSPGLQGSVQQASPASFWDRIKAIIPRRSRPAQRPDDAQTQRTKSHLARQYVKYSPRLNRMFPFKFDVRLVDANVPDAHFAWIGRDLKNLLDVDSHPDKWTVHRRPEGRVLERVFELVWQVPLDIIKPSATVYSQPFYIDVSVKHYGSWWRRPLVNSQPLMISCAQLEHDMNPERIQDTSVLYTIDPTPDLVPGRWTTIFTDFALSGLRVDKMKRDCLRTPATFANCQKYRVLRFISYLARLDIFNERMRQAPVSFFQPEQHVGDTTPAYPNFDLEHYLINCKRRTEAVDDKIRDFELDLFGSLFGRVVFMKERNRKRVIRLWEQTVGEQGDVPGARYEMHMPAPKYDSDDSDDDDENSSSPSVDDDSQEQKADDADGEVGKADTETINADTDSNEVSSSSDEDTESDDDDEEEDEDEEEHVGRMARMWKWLRGKFKRQPAKPKKREIMLEKLLGTLHAVRLRHEETEQTRLRQMKEASRRPPVSTSITAPRTSPMAVNFNAAARVDGVTLEDIYASDPEGVAASSFQRVSELGAEAVGAVGAAVQSGFVKLANSCGLRRQVPVDKGEAKERVEDPNEAAEQAAEKDIIKEMSAEITAANGNADKKPGVHLHKRSLTLLGAAVVISGVTAALAFSVVAIGMVIEGHWFFSQENYFYYRDAINSDLLLRKGKVSAAAHKPPTATSDEQQA